MRCPVCKEKLLLIHDRSDWKIYICFDCQVEWHDKGEGLKTVYDVNKEGIW